MRRIAARVSLGLVAVLLALQITTPAASAAFAPVGGAGSTWSFNALDQWRRNVVQYGWTVNYAPTGSSDGRNQFRNGSVDFAVSEIPYGEGEYGTVESPPSRGFAYMPIVAGGTSFMYHLTVGGRQVTNLRLSGDVLTKIFTGVITKWDDAAIAADNPGLALPAKQIVPVVRSDGSGTSAQFTKWMSKQHPGLWNAYCQQAAGRQPPCGLTSNYPVVNGSAFVRQSGSDGVANYVRGAPGEGSITYVEYSYARNAQYPVAKILNAAGYYVEPTARNVAVGLLGARIDSNPDPRFYLTQNLDGVYGNADKRAYPLSSYSYMILPTTSDFGFTGDKAQTLSEFAYYFLCEGQQQAESLGYSPLPINLVQAGFEQVKRIPGGTKENPSIQGCNNPTFSTDGSNTLANTAPQPPECDRKGGPTQCTTGTGGATAETPVSNQTAAATAAAQQESAAAAAAAAGSAATGAAATGSAAPAAADPSAAATAAVDPDTGEVLGAESAATGSDVAAVPVTLAAANSSGQQTALIVLAALLLLGVVLVPPLLARGLSDKNPRHGAGP